MMITVSQARAKALRHYERHYKDWATEQFSLAIAAFGVKLGVVSERVHEAAFGVKSESAAAALKPTSKHSFSLPLHPPTEQQVLKDQQAARLWVQSWRNLDCKGYSTCSARKDSKAYKFYKEEMQIHWVKREWASVGHQEVPERLLLLNPEIISAFAQREQEWHRVLQRVNELACLCLKQWFPHCLKRDMAALSLTLHKQISNLCSLDDANWTTFIAVIDWLVNNQNQKCYVRQLPIRGIDSKWFEAHQKMIEPVYCALTGKAKPDFMQQPHLIRVRFLDITLAPEGFSDVSVPAQELNSYAQRPAAVLVCENLVSFLALPPILGTIAIFGSGYGVSILSEVSWLNSVALWYWGDLDSNGFAILNRLRHHFSHAKSLMMDSATLDIHRDLCVYEPSPNRSELTHLSADEKKTLAKLLSGDKALRLEQERIEWQYALEQLRAITKAM